MLTGLFRAYASILFAEKAWIGGLFMLATFWFPNAGLSGLLAALVGILTARLLSFTHLESGLHVYNSLLVGLALGAYYQLDMYLGMLIILGAVMAVFTTVALADMLWRLDHIPALSLPFVLVALTVTLAANSYGTLSRYLLPMAPHEVFIHPWIDQFLTALGTAFFIPHPLPGLLMFIAIFCTSRYMALLAVTGFAVGFGSYSLLTGSPHPDLVSWNGFNFILTAMALGGIFTVPDKQSFILAMVGSVLAALVTSATETFMLVYGLPVMALPFLMTTLILLLALKKRPHSAQLQLLLEAPALPEISRERARMAEVRNGEFGSTPTLLPFYGRWTVYQGFNGRHTHRPPWQHALDFYITDQEKSFANDGLSLEDYYCFSLPVIAPVEGYVVAAEAALPDKKPGEVDTDNNWGNYLLIRMHNDKYLLLAHLKQHSIEVMVGSYVVIGQTLAKCGSSGRSPQPHLHMHVQSGVALGSITQPFHISTSLLRNSASVDDEFQLFSCPNEGEMVMTPKLDQALRSSMDLRVGYTFDYHVDDHVGTVKPQTLTVMLTLDGQFRLRSSSGASAAFINQPNLLAFYDRQGPKDQLLDAIMLALGLTPFGEGISLWQDQPSMQLLPLTPWQQALARVCYPLGQGLSSRYSRQWCGDHWLQQGEHELAFLFGEPCKATTSAKIVPSSTCVEITLQSETVQLTATLSQFGQQADAGIPQWNIQLENRKE